MEELIVSGSQTIPKVYFDGNKGVFSISGRSLPEQAHKLFNPILEWMDLYAQNAKPVTTFNITLEYINSSSNKYLLLVMKKLEKLNNPSNEVVVNWYYETNDEDAKESGEEYRDLLKIPVNILECHSY